MARLAEQEAIADPNRKGGAPGWQNLRGMQQWNATATTAQQAESGSDTEPAQCRERADAGCSRAHTYSQLFPEPRRERVARRALLELFVVAVERDGALNQHFLGLDVLRVGQAALHRADRLAGFVIVETHAFGAQIRIDDVNFIAFGDGVIRAFRLARSAVDTVVGDESRHCPGFCAIFLRGGLIRGLRARSYEWPGGRVNFE